MGGEGENKAKEVRCIECRIPMMSALIEHEGIAFEGCRCPQCGHTVLTLDQLRQHNRLRDMRRLLPEKRKIVKIGNSLGITLPGFLKEYGLQAGREVELEVIDAVTLQVRFCPSPGSRE
ncbi:MAG: AbrB/MazE/SpoVT family DNA-binding domain-containing protein [Candidatus Eremiobacteraeota bacterium]|nr:AbrB/MazE/SpoVT family DNA-binding domain-containing protein [Candidatus Eremiobacteraeota bacterium]